MAQGFLALVGVVLVVSGLLGFIINPFVGAGPNNNGTDVILAANAVHNIVHLATGALALYFAFATSGEAQVNGVLIFGAVYALILVLVLVSPTLFGLFNPIPANIGDHVLHAALAVVSFGVWYLAKNSSTNTVAAR
jgi:hypothetical protein